MTTRTFILSRSDITAVSRCAAIKDIRFYLNGVLLEIGAMSSRLVATDGRILACLNVTDVFDVNLCDKTLQYIIPNDIVAKLKPKKRSEDQFELTVRPADREGKVAAQVAFEGQTVDFQMIDGVFPDYRRVIPQKLAGGVVQFDPSLLVRFQKAVVDLGHDKGWMRVTPNSANSISGALLTCQEPRLVGVVMPWLCKNELGALPYESPTWVHDTMVPPSIELRKAA